MATYTLVLAIMFPVSVILAWSCHHVVTGVYCGLLFPRFGLAAVITTLIGGHSLACASAVFFAPAHRRIVGLVAVVLPVAYIALDGRNSVTDVLGLVLAGLPTALFTFFLVRRLETRRPG